MFVGVAEAAIAAKSVAEKAIAESAWVRGFIEMMWLRLLLAMGLFQPCAAMSLE